MEFKVHHIGYAVPDIARAIEEFSGLGWSLASNITDDDVRKVKIAFVTMGCSVVELVAPAASDSPIAKQLSKGSGAPYHICYEVSSISAAEAYLKERGFIVFKKSAVAPAIGFRNVEFLYSKQNGVIELVEV